MARKGPQNRERSEAATEPRDEVGLDSPWVVNSFPSLSAAAEFPIQSQSIFNWVLMFLKSSVSCRWLICSYGVDKWRRFAGPQPKQVPGLQISAKKSPPRLPFSCAASAVVARLHCCSEPAHSQTKGGLSCHPWSRGRQCVTPGRRFEKAVRV